MPLKLNEFHGKLCLTHFSKKKQTHFENTGSIDKNKVLVTFLSQF